MAYEDMYKFQEYFRLRPPEWRHAVYAFRIMQSFSGSKMKPWEIFPELYNVYHDDRKKESPLDSLKNSSLGSFMKKAKGGDKVNVFGN